MALLLPLPLEEPKPEPIPGGERLLSTPYFHLYRFPLRGRLVLQADGPLLLTLVEGEARLLGERLPLWATFLLEAGEGLFLGASPG